MRLPNIGNRRWVSMANCRDRDPAIFFNYGPSGKPKRNLEHAREICRACPVRLVCLQTHLLEADGIFGGTTPKERIAFLMERKFASWSCAEYYSKLRDHLIRIKANQGSQLSSGELLAHLQRANPAYVTHRPTSRLVHGVFL